MRILGQADTETGLRTKDGATFYLGLVSASTAALTADRTLTWDLGDAARTFKARGNVNLAGDLVTTAAFSGLPVASGLVSVVSFTAFNPVDIAGTMKNATARSIDVAAFSGLAISAIAAGVVTFTFTNMGTYLFAITVVATHGEAYTMSRGTLTIGGTGTSYTNPTLSANSLANNDDQYSGFTFISQPTAAQTVTVKFAAQTTQGGGDVTKHNYAAKVTVVQL